MVSNNLLVLQFANVTVCFRMGNGSLGIILSINNYNKW